MLSFQPVHSSYTGSQAGRVFALDTATNAEIWRFPPASQQAGKGALVDVVNPRGEYLDSFYLPLPNGVGPHDLARYPLAISGRALFVLEELEDGRLEVVKYEIVR